MQEWLFKVRDSGSIDRFHTRNLVRPQNIATHSFNTFFIVAEMMPGVSDVNFERLLIYTMIHDVPETSTGDVVGCVKKQNPDLKNILDKIEEDWVECNMPNYLRVHYYNITPKEECIAKFADLIDCLWKSLEEFRYGNTGLRVAVKDCCRQINMKKDALDWRDIEINLGRILSEIDNEFDEELEKCLDWED